MKELDWYGESVKVCEARDYIEMVNYIMGFNEKMHTRVVYIFCVVSFYIIIKLNT